MDCLFCSIIKKEKEARIIYEDDAAVAILDVFPCAVGHTLVLPKTHVENILEVSDGDLGPLFLSVKNVTKLLEQKLHPRGFTIGINHGKVSGQAIEHLHIHIMPRYEGDGGGSMHGVVDNPGTESLDIIFEKITHS